MSLCFNGPVKPCFWFQFFQLYISVVLQPYNNVVGFPNRKTVKIVAKDSNVTLHLDITLDNNVLVFGKQFCPNVALTFSVFQTKKSLNDNLNTSGQTFKCFAVPSQNVFFFVMVRLIHHGFYRT